MAACKCKEVECEECPEWIFTLADLIMCMMGLFVLLWVLKPGGASDDTAASKSDDYVTMIASIRSEFGYMPDPQSQDPIDLAVLAMRAGTQVPKGKNEGGKTTQERQGNEGTAPEVLTIREGQRAITGGKILYAAGATDLTPENDKALDGLASLIRGHRNIVMIKGHASLDDLGPDAPSTRVMDLSVRRAQAVADALVQRGVSADVLRVQGCATFEPVVQRDYTPGGQASNRRVEVESTNKLVDELAR